SLEFGVWSLEFGVWSLEFGVWNFGVWKLGVPVTSTNSNATTGSLRSRPWRSHNQRIRSTDRPNGALGLHVLVDEGRHLEHVHLRLAEDRAQAVVGLDHALVLLVLQAVLLDVRPELLGQLGAGQRLGANDFRELRARRDGRHERGVWPAATAFLRSLLL